MDLQELKKDILEDGIIDVNEVTRIKTILYADGVIEKEEAEFLFALNDEAGDNSCPEWSDFFVQAIADFLLRDEISPNKIDDDEALWLVAKIGTDGKVDSNEKLILEKLKSEANNFPACLAELLQ